MMDLRKRFGPWLNWTFQVATNSRTSWRFTTQHSHPNCAIGHQPKGSNGTPLERGACQLLLSFKERGPRVFLPVISSSGTMGNVCGFSIGHLSHRHENTILRRAQVLALHLQSK
eukprot:s1362_g5.t2